MIPESRVYDVLNRFRDVLRGSVVPLGNHGGFSGAQLWRIETPAGNFALKAWPTGWRSATDLAWIHGLMAKAAAHPWMPRAIAAEDGATFIELEGRLWEIVTWQPGAADYWSAPSQGRLQAAATALAELHLTWNVGETGVDACPAVRRHMATWQTWTDLVQSGWQPVFVPLDPYQPAAERLWQLVRAKIDAVPMMLSAWINRKLPVQPCVCDLWHDHVLFTQDTVTGIVDFGSVKMDHVCVDVARLFGSLIGGDDPSWQIALAAYERVRPLSLAERTLAKVLDRTGTLLAATNWLRWLYHEIRVYPDPAAVTARLEALARRLSQ